MIEYFTVALVLVALLCCFLYGLFWNEKKNDCLLYQNIAKLVKVKTVVTFVVIGVFAYLACIEKIPSDQVITVTTMIVGFYFGTQKEKKE